MDDDALRGAMTTTMTALTHQDDGTTMTAETIIYANPRRPT
jgi:hypothetical protein